MPGFSPTVTSIVSRPFQTDDDFWRIRRLAIETYPITGRGWNWEIRRWDGSRFHHPDPNNYLEKFKDTVRMWETTDGQLVGVANRDGTELFYLQMHPDYRDLEEEMVAWAEDHLAEKLPDGSRKLITEVYEYDTPRQRLLEKRGYTKQADGGVARWMHFGERALPEARLSEGYRLRSVHAEDLQDCQHIADLLNAAFHRNFHNAAEFQQFARTAPSYQEDLHLVAVAPDGSFGAFVGVIYEAENRRGLYEPVCTHPAHRKKGLAQSLMFEGLRRLKALGACEMTVETGLSMGPANALYELDRLHRGASVLRLGENLGRRKIARSCRKTWKKTQSVF